jgi:hypothetical protein
MRRPEEERIVLPNDDDWIVVKRHLTAGEQRELFARMIKTMTPGEKVELDPKQVGITLIIAYLLDWSILDADGNAVLIRRQPVERVAAALENLEPEKYGEINDAITAHDEAMRTVRETEKKDRAGAMASSATSVSVG